MSPSNGLRPRPATGARRATTAVLGAVGILVCAAVQADAQLAERVRSAGDGTVRFAYETRPGVEVCDRGVRIRDRHVYWNGRDDRYDDVRCTRDGVEVELEVRRGLVLDVEIVRAPRDRDPEAVDLGRVPANEAADYLLSLARAGATAGGAEDAILPAMLADAGEQWRALLDLARDRGLSERVRKSALFWLGQEAADAATAGLAGVALDESEEQEVRNSAIFALSQRPNSEAIPVLMQVAREGEQAETRRTAMFWLAQSDDDRVVRFFEEILLGRIR